MGIRAGYSDRVRGVAGGSRVMRDRQDDIRGYLSRPDPKPNAWDCARRLKSCGYVPEEHIRKHGDWHVYRTDRGIVAITRHPGGRWEIKAMPVAAEAG